MASGQHMAPIVRVVENEFPSDNSVQVERVSFTAGGLVITVASRVSTAEVQFEQIYGFRVLDEFDLTEFWSECTLQDGWLFEVTKGGWKDLELTRPQFLSARQDWVREYLIIGLDECVSVLTKEDPKVLSRTTRKKTVSLTFRGFAAPAETVAGSLAVPASMYGNRGEPVRPTVQTRLSRSYARFELIVADDPPLDAMFPALLLRLGGMDRIKALRDAVRPEFIDVSFDVPARSSEDSQDGYLSAETVAHLQELEGGVSFSFF